MEANSNSEEARKRFEDRYEQNVKDLQKSKEDFQKKRSEEMNPDECVADFDLRFAEKIRGIREKLQSLTREDPVNERIEELRRELMTCSELLNQSVHFLNSYTIMQGQFLITQVQDEISSTQQNLAPRKKFAFSKRAAKKENTNNNLEVKQEEKSQLVLEGIRDQAGGTFYKTALDMRGVSSYQLQNLENCEIVISATLNAIHMVGLKHCHVFVGAVSGAAHITDCTDCVINVACHQLRIHQTYRCQFYVFVATGPIVENVSELGFGPYRFKYPNMEEHFESCGFKGENQYDQVQDFK
mmetsp:Transcript_30346/g.29994  ORF Transcript_30346/g.29994 Transcript_30346/m.29994 type:complete len:298 (+) Transcript_30346:1-894(+)